MTAAALDRPDEIAERKRALRQELKAARRSRSEAERASAAEGVTAQLVALTEKLDARTVVCYLSLPDEPDTRPYLEWAASKGIRILLPVAREDGLLDWAVSGAGEVTGRHGMPEPVGELLGPIALADADLVLVPASSVDRLGVRMGWGLGYFDKALRSVTCSGPVYALVFDEEFVDAVPREVHDQAVNGVVTPSWTVQLPLAPDVPTDVIVIRSSD